MRAIIPPRRGRTLTVCGHVVSGSLSLPFRGSFHRSLTVLLRYRSGGYLALEGGPPGFPQGSSCPVVLKPPAEARDPVDYRAVTVSGGSSQSASPGVSHLGPFLVRPRPDRPVLPTSIRHGPAGSSAGWLWAAPRSLAATGGISVDFFSTGY